MKTSTRIALLFVLLLLFTAASGWTIFMSPELVPVDRLVKSAEAHLAQHPEKAVAHYTLARIHYLAFVTNLDKVAAYPNMDADVGVYGAKAAAHPRPSVADDWARRFARDGDTKTVAMPLPAPQLIDHAARDAKFQ